MISDNHILNCFPGVSLMSCPCPSAILYFTFSRFYLRTSFRVSGHVNIRKTSVTPRAYGRKMQPVVFS